MTVKRSRLIALRNEIGYREAEIKREDRSAQANRERDLSAEACVALWELDVKRVLSCLSRLKSVRSSWQDAWDMALSLFRPAL